MVYNNLNIFIRLSFILSHGRQIIFICAGFLATGLIIGAKTAEQVPLLIMMLGFLIFSLVFTTLLQFLFFKIHDLHTSLRQLRRAAEDMEGSIGKEAARELLRDIEDLEPVSGYGLFSVDRSALTSSVSVSITYLIILIQFKQTALSFS